MRVPASLLANLPCSGVRERSIIDLMSRTAARIAFLVIPAFAAGAFVSLLKALGVSANAKLVIGREGMAPAFSIAPLLLLSMRSPGQSRTSAASSR
jgi:hypothetical protein